MLQQLDVCKNDYVPENIITERKLIAWEFDLAQIWNYERYEVKSVRSITLFVLREGLWCLFTWSALAKLYSCNFIHQPKQEQKIVSLSIFRIHQPNIDGFYWKFKEYYFAPHILPVKPPQLKTTNYILSWLRQDHKQRICTKKNNHFKTWEQAVRYKFVFT